MTNELCNYIIHGPETKKEAIEMAGAVWYDHYINEKIEPWDTICVKEKGHKGFHKYEMHRRNQ